MENEFNFQSGAVIDDRSDEEKSKDFNFKEIVSAAAPVEWIEKAERDWRKFPDQQQDGSGSCVAQTIKKLACVLLWLKEKTFVIFSATSIYQRRSNKPGSGMVGVEAFDIWKDNGITLEALVPSENMNDSQMDALPVEDYETEVGKIFKIANHVGITAGEFETVASIIQETGKAVMTWFYFLSSEWSPLIPVVSDHNLKCSNALRHSVAAVDFFLYGGKKYILIEDSSHFGGITRRLISEEFFRERNWFARYPMTFKFDDKTVSPPTPTPVIPPTPIKPKHKFNKVLIFGMNDVDVKSLQDILKFEGFFPSNVESTGYYGAITAKGLLAWQIKHAVASAQELNYLQGRRVGEKTLTKLNNLYA